MKSPVIFFFMSKEKYHIIKNHIKIHGFNEKIFFVIVSILYKEIYNLLHLYIYGL